MAAGPRGRRGEPGRRGAQRPPSGVPGGLDAVFGVHAVRALIERGEAPRELWVQEGDAGRRLAELVEAARRLGARVQSRPRDDLDRLAQGAAHQGVVALCPPLSAESEAALWFRLEAWSLAAPPLLLVLDGVTDVHNFGACLRSADAAGVQGVIVPKDKAAPLNATVRKVACGAAESVPVYQVTNLARALAKLKALGVWVIGTAGEAEILVYEADFTGPVALVMGAEGKGLRRLTREACDSLVKLPMAGAVSSLNVSVATGVALFEAVRQRRTGSPASDG
ncbi:23S rRNA (guanosine(2251)-2'-O)-methyltransferase RlmB [Halomonas campisalis]|uniref:23S rRNA (guanosine-2'-O-)-methyltransferase RlmB n=1 Tax=Billgrantia campisalis TaxID=74661 RepID=A0ABS9P897_9GAMM|nr:23S rRNA (guanosine(2251)-2'-O)-methyltransferase RlmB [Halomonas campisalis]MCG6657689.1 23S rRNA (guanosine(2251)-2'-O)-methyltransferase RlmB [Halomonas campisalis]MDR5862539.1 23S rRNA (guanosine(2251)-2'-O)-methyltransferase RlmB [Halomonas campisalis]